jgi:cytochrome c oxidase cbb3-type subunit 3
MNDLMDPVWDIYVAVATIVSIVACGVFLKSQSIKRVDASQAGGKTATTGHVWDGDLAEYNNPLPRWWAWMFYLTIVFSLGYVVLYPALGSSFKGLLGWSQVGQLEEENKAAEKAYGPLYEAFAKQELPQLAASPDALAVGQKLFLNNCAQCHASDGGGSRGFPNLTDGDWLWGSDPKVIQATIADGRTGVMPPFGPALGEQGVKNAAHYVMSLSGMAHDSIRASIGKETFASTCAACHGQQGKGNPALGAPDLTDKVWLHGEGEPAIIDVIARGRSNQMPAHKDVLTPAKIKLLTAYVMSLSAPGR